MHLEGHVVHVHCTSLDQDCAAVVLVMRGLPDGNEGTFARGDDAAVDCCERGGVLDYQRTAVFVVVELALYLVRGRGEEKGRR